jgi:hypothetical protein
MWKIEELDKMIEEKIESEIIRCPLCDAVNFDPTNDDIENVDELITYWGDNEKKMFCDNCDNEFLVKENVQRTFECFPVTSDDTLNK